MFAKEKQNYRCVVSTNPSDDSRKPITEAERMKTQSKAMKKCSTTNILGKAGKKVITERKREYIIFIIVMDVHLVLKGLLSNLINFEKYRHCLMLLGNTLNNLAEVS